MMGLNIEQQWWDHADSLLPADVSLGEKTRTIRKQYFKSGMYEGKGPVTLPEQENL